MVDWLQGDLASWLAVALMVVAALLAWRALRPTSYIEFHDNWKITAKDNTLTATGHIAMDSPSSRTTGSGSFEFNKTKIPLHLKSVNQHMVYRAYVCVFEGEYGKGISGDYLGVLKLKIRLGDGTTKKYKKQIQLARETIS